jgi:hypothetical protein
VTNHVPGTNVHATEEESQEQQEIYLINLKELTLGTTRGYYNIYALEPGTDLRNSIKRNSVYWGSDLGNSNKNHSVYRGHNKGESNKSHSLFRELTWGTATRVTACTGELTWGTSTRVTACSGNRPRGEQQVPIHVPGTDVP